MVDEHFAGHLITTIDRPMAPFALVKLAQSTLQQLEYHYHRKEYPGLLRFWFIIGGSLTSGP